jgi:PAP2 superfamily
MAARLEVPRAGARPVTGAAPARRAGLAWPRLPAAAELATIGAGYAGYALVRLAIHADRQAAFAHAAQLWQAERRMHLRIEPWLNRLVAARPPLAEAAGYYYGLLHFIITPLVLAWLYWRRPAAFGRLRSALVLATTAANVVFWAWPAAPPRLAVRGMTDILATRDILGAADPHGATSLVNLYAAMPSLHVAWAAWCATAIVITTRSRWRHLAWLYPAATTLVVLASANHFLLDTAGGLAVTALGMLAAGRPGRLAAGRRARPASPRHRHPPGTRVPARATSRRRPAAGRPAPGRTGRASRWRALAAGHRTRAAATGRYTADKCPAGCSARARRPAPARPRRERR